MVNKILATAEPLWEFPMISETVTHDTAVIRDGHGEVVYMVVAVNPNAVAKQVTDLACMVANETYSKTRELYLDDVERIAVLISVEVKISKWKETHGKRDTVPSRRRDPDKGRPGE